MVVNNHRPYTFIVYIILFLILIPQSIESKLLVYISIASLLTFLHIYDEHTLNI